MKHMMKRSLSMLLLLVMVLTVFPVMSSTAVAAEPEGNVDPAELYVTDGATLFLTPDGVDVEAGTWASCVGSLAATLKGGAYNAETNPTGWRTNEGGIPYYRLQDPSVFGEKRGKVGIVLPTEAISDGDFTFEALFKPLYLSGEDGVVVPHTETSGPSYWGAYSSGDHSAFSLAGLQFTFFHPSIAGSGNSSTLRMYYHPSAWEYDDANYGCPNGKVDCRELRYPMGKYSTEEDTLIHSYSTMSVVRTVGAMGTVYRRAHFQVNVNNVTENYANGEGNTAFDKNSNVHHNFYTLEMLEAHSGNNEPFSAFFAFPAEVCMIRVYNRALSQDERNQNHFADLMLMHGIELTKSYYYGLSETQRSLLHSALADVRVQDGKAAVMNVIDRYNDLESTKTVYDKLYVQDGLVQLLSAFTAAEAQAIVDSGIWNNKVNANGATVHGGAYNAEIKPYGWKVRGNGGIGYDLLNQEMKDGMGNDSWIDLGANIVDSLGDYTLEYAASLPVVTDGSPSGYNLARMNEKFGHWGTWNLDGSVRVLYHMNGYNESHNNGYGCLNWGESSFTLSSNIRTYANVIDNTPVTSRRTVMRDGYLYTTYELVGKQEAATTNVDGVDTHLVITKLDRPLPVFFVLRNTTNSVYSIRVYNRALSEGELAINHFVDLCAYTGANVDTYVTLNDYVKVNLAYMFVNTPLNHVDKATVENAIATAATMEMGVSEYDGLYVKDGLTALFTAFKASDVNLLGNYWTSKLGDTRILLVDESDATQWTAGADGRGVGYSFNTVSGLASNLNKIGMRLPTSILTDGNMAIEYVFHANPIMQGDRQVCGTNTDKPATSSVVYENIGGGYPYGVYYASPVSSFSFAGLNMCQFHWVDYDGAATVSRFYYGHGAWEDIGGDAGGARADRGLQLIGTKENGINTFVQSLSVNRTVSEPLPETDYLSVDFQLYQNGFLGTSVNNQAGSDNQRKFYTVEELNSARYGYDANHAFFSLPSTVFAIRMYDRTLTEAEMRQNHAVDMMAYFGLNVAGFAALDDSAKADVYAALANQDFNATAVEVAAMQSAIDRAVADAALAVIGYQESDDNTALRIWGAVDSIEGVSRVGFVITFKQGGETVKTFGEASADNDTTVTKTVFDSLKTGGTVYTNQDLCTPYLYAAVVKGIPAGTYTVEVTPFYVTQTDAVTVGEMKSATITFGAE